MFGRKVRALIGVTTLAGLAVGCSASDAGVTTKVKAKLAADDTVKAYRIDVDTKEGVVTLSGQIDTPAAKGRAVELARATEGVRSVVDNTTVAAAAATAEAPQAIHSSAPFNATTLQLTMTAPHGLQVGDSVYITGHNSTPPLEGSYTVVTVPDKTVFRITVPGLTDKSGGPAGGTVSKKAGS